MARLDVARLDSLLRPDAAWRVALLHGPDGGLVRDCGQRLVAACTGGDPLRRVELGREAARDPGLLVAEVATPALLGGGRTVLIRDAADAWAASLEGVLAGAGPGRVVLEAGELAPKSRLRSLCEGAAGAVAVACAAPIGEALRSGIVASLMERGATAEPDAIGYLADRLGDDSALLRVELDKLAMAAAKGDPITPELARALVAGETEWDGDATVLAALAGKVGLVDAGLAAAAGNGVSSVQVLRGALFLVSRLQSGRPPLPASLRSMAQAAVRRWPPRRLAALGVRLLDAERQAKTTGLPDMTVTRQLLLSLALSDG